jgi:hypothetical protein
MITQAPFLFLKMVSRTLFLDLTGKRQEIARNVVFIVMLSLLWHFQAI